MITLQDRLNSKKSRTILHGFTCRYVLYIYIASFSLLILNRWRDTTTLPLPAYSFVLQTGKKSRSSFLHGFRVYLQDWSPGTRVEIPESRKPSAFQVQHWTGRQNGCYQYPSYVVWIPMEAQAMRDTGKGTEAMLSGVLRAETKRGASAGKNCPSTGKTQIQQQHQSKGKRRKTSLAFEHLSTRRRIL